MKELLITLSTLMLFSTVATSQIGRLALSPSQKIEQVIAKINISKLLKPEKKKYGMTTGQRLD